MPNDDGTESVAERCDGTESITLRQDEIIEACRDWMKKNWPGQGMPDTAKVESSFEIGPDRFYVKFTWDKEERE